MAIAAVVLTLVQGPSERARALASAARVPGLTLAEDGGGPRLGAVLEVGEDADLEPRFAELRAVPGVLEAALAAAWLEDGEESGTGRSGA